MNFSPFGGHFSTTIPAIHQFAAKFTHDNSTNTLCTQDNSRYTANGVPSFTQHHPPNQQQMLNNSKYQGNYMNQGVYTHQNNIRQDKRQGYEQQHELAQELCAVMLQHTQSQQLPEKQNADKVCKPNVLDFVHFL